MNAAKNVGDGRVGLGCYGNGGKLFSLPASRGYRRGKVAVGEAAAEYPIWGPDDEEGSGARGSKADEVEQGLARKGKGKERGDALTKEVGAPCLFARPERRQAPGGL